MIPSGGRRLADSSGLVMPDSTLKGGHGELTLSSRRKPWTLRPGLECSSQQDLLEVSREEVRDEIRRTKCRCDSQASACSFAPLMNEIVNSPSPNPTGP